jgi:hypothetical protein
MSEKIVIKQAIELKKGEVIITKFGTLPPFRDEVRSVKLDLGKVIVEIECSSPLPLTNIYEEGSTITVAISG